MNTLWKSGTQKAYYGYVASLVVSVLGGFILEMMEPDLFEMATGGGSGYYAMSVVFGIASVAALVYYFLGLKEMKEATANTKLATATNRLYIACIILVASAALALLLDSFSDGASILVALVLIGIAELTGFILTWLGYAALKNDATNANAKEGGAQLCTAALITVVTTAIGLIPVLWWVAPIGGVVALYFAFMGWKSLANSELE